MDGIYRSERLTEPFDRTATFMRGAGSLTAHGFEIVQEIPDTRALDAEKG